MAEREALKDILARQLNHHIEQKIKKAETTQKTLYHYTSVDSLMGMIETNRLWMSKGTFLNDSSELVYIKNIVESAIRKMEERTVYPPFWDLFIHELYFALERFLTEIVDEGSEVYIFSLSYTQDSLALWYNYAKGEGYNIGFEAEKLLQKVNDTSQGNEVLYGLVVYDREEQEAILMDFLMTAFEQLNKREAAELKETLPKHFSSIIAACAIFFKEPAFSSEEEYRIAFIRRKDNKSKDVFFRSQNGVIVPYITMDFEARLPISHITIGPKNNIDIAKSGIEFYLKTKGYDLSSLTVTKSVAALRY